MRALDYLDKNRKLVKVLRILSQVGLWASAAAVVISLPLAVSLAGGNNWGIFQAIPENLDFGYVDGVIRFNVMLTDITPRQVQIITAQILFSITVYGAVFGAVMFYLSNVLKTVENRMPFARENARRIASMGLVFLAGSLFTGMIQAGTANAIIQTLRLTEMMSVNYSLNSSMLITGLLLFVLSGIFRYGAYLQEEYDATL